MKTTLLSIAFALLISYVAVAQDNQWVAYTNGDIVLSVVADDRYVWTGTSFGGLVKNDMLNDSTTFYNMVNSPLPSNWVTDLAIGPEGELWLMSGYHLLKFHNDQWTLYDTVNLLVGDSYFNFDVTPSGDVWIGNSNVLIRFNEDSVKVYDGNDWEMFNGAWDIKAAGNDTVWFANTPYGLNMFDGTNWHTYDDFDVDGDITEIDIDAENNIWATSTYTVGMFDGANWTVYDSVNSPIEVYNSSLAISPDGGVYVAGMHRISHLDTAGTWTSWLVDLENDEVIQTLDVFNDDLLVGTHKAGLRLMTENGWVQITTSNSGLTDSYIRDFAFNDSLTAIAAQNGGLILFNDTDWIVYDTSNSPIQSNMVFSVAIDKSGAIWAGTQDGLARLANDTWTVWTMTGNDGPNGSIPWEGVMDIFIDETGRVWTVDAHAVRYVENDEIVMVEDSWNDYYYSEIVMDTAGTIWVSNTVTGLYSFDGTSFMAVNAPTYNLTALAIDTLTNTLWIGSTDEGLLSYNEGIFEQYEPENSDNPSYNIISLDVDNQGKIWMLTTEGMASFDGEEFTLFNDSTTGIDLSMSVSIKIDPWNNKWIGTPGIIIYNESGVTVETDDLPAAVFTNNPRIWPSPATGYLNVESNDNILRADIYNINGQLLLTRHAMTQQISLPMSQLQSGVYILILTTEKGVTTSKFVKR